MVSERFSDRYLKCSFLFRSLSSYQVTFSFALAVIVLTLTSFGICHIIPDCQYSTEFLILLIWPWIYSHWSFWYMLVCSFLALLSSCRLEFVGFLLLSKKKFFSNFVYFQTTCDSHGILHLSLGLVGSIWAVTKSSYSSFGVCLSDISWRVSNFFLTVTIYLLFISLGKWWPVKSSSFDCFLFLRRFRCILAMTNLWSEDTPRKEMHASPLSAVDPFTKRTHK